MFGFPYICPFVDDMSCDEFDLDANEWPHDPRMFATVSEEVGQMIAKASRNSGTGIYLTIEEVFGTSEEKKE